MKKLHLFIAAISMLISLNSNAQNQRMLVFECFTNTSCGPCASQNPALDALIQANSDRVAAIKYHMNWPGANDPMFLHNTADNGARKSFYNVSAVPYTAVDGNKYNNSPAGINQNMVNQWLALESPVEMRMTHQLNATEDTITVIVMAKALSGISGNLKLMVGVIENEIHYTSAPGSNGERDFYSVMKKLLPTSSGKSISDMAEGDYFAYEFSWALENVYNKDQLSAIAWIQDANNKAVYQACKSTENLTPFYSNEAALNNISNVKNMICSGTANPNVVITNFGANSLTNADIEVKVNDEVVKNLSWEGALATFASATINIGEIVFPVVSNNTLEINIVGTNGTEDEANINNATSLNFTGSPDNSEKTIKLTIRTDNDPQETTWKITSMTTGEVVLEGGPYTEASTLFTETLTLPGDDCYDFTIYDAGGNGFSNGSGLYGLKAGSSTLFSGSNFGYSESNEFSYEVVAGTDENTLDNTIFPNPTTGIISITREGECAVTVYNMAGQCVLQTSMKDFAQLDLRPFGKGLYTIRIGEKTARIILK